MFSLIVFKFDWLGIKDSVVQIVESWVFCINIVDGVMCEQVNVSSVVLLVGSSEFEVVGIEMVECEIIDCLCVVYVVVSLECCMMWVVWLVGEVNIMVMGVVIGIYICFDCFVDGCFVFVLGYLLWLGYKDYVIIIDIFEMECF